MFRGRHDHTIDVKGRVSIPAGFRMEIQRRSEKPPVITNDKDCLALYPYEDWVAFEERLVKASQLQPEVQAVTRFFVSNAEDAPIDSQGRILIPKHLRNHASLERQVTVAGMGSRIEIWDTHALEQELARTYDRLDEYRVVVASLDK